MENNSPRKLPVLPNHNSVILPDIQFTLNAKNNYDRNLFSTLEKGDEFVISYSSQENIYGDFDNLILPGVRTVGCLCRVVNIISSGDGYEVTCIGKNPVDMFNFSADFDKEIVFCNLENRAVYRGDTFSNRIYEELGKFSSAYIKLKNQFKDLPELPDFVQTVPDVNNVVYHIAVFLNSSNLVKQEILEEKDSIERVRKIIGDLDRFNLDSSIEFNIQQAVSASIDKNQREYILREKMKALRKQLNEFDGSDSYAKYTRLLEKHPNDFPDNIKNRIKVETSRLETLPAGSQETSVLQNYLDLITSLPWNKSSIDNDDFDSVKKVLDENHYGLVKQKERILQYLAVKQLTNSLKAPILCFYGAPGVGKTSLAISIAQALGRKFIKIALGGISDEAEIRGHRRTYVGAMPGKIISSINKVGTNNPVFLLDEIDKVNGGGYHGDPASALLEVLDPEQNSSFTDNYLDEPFDLSHVMFICTANDISKIPLPLLDRLELIELNTYTKFEKLAIAKEHLIDLEEKANGIKPGMLEWTDNALEYIIEFYTREAGVRELRRKIGTIDRKFAVEHLQSPDFKTLKITVDVVKKYLGSEIFIRERDVSNSQVGIVNGLAYTDAGGEVLKIEVNTYPGKGQLILTGNLGDVMKEACETALSYVKALGPEIGINPLFFSDNDIHIHFPEGATPKDGPSAGVATAICLISAICDLRIRNDVAMTGEIDLRGNSMPIGGLREKCNAACREHIKTVFIPYENHRDRLELPTEIASNLNIVEVKSIKDLFSGVYLEDLAKKKRKIYSLTTPKKNTVKKTSKKNVKSN